jgi:hypothetical protein
MSKTARTLEIEEDLNFQRKEWLGQRIGMALLFGFVVAAFLGATGMGGPLARAEARDPGGALRVEYERFVRRGAHATARVHVRAASGAVRLWVSAPYLEHVRIESVAPEPETVAVDADRHVYSIRTGSGDVTITLDIEHQAAGRLDAQVGLVDGPSVQFSQLALF